ncbi:MAG TPA: DUF1501 domain-containing protein [Planctomycetaceae bacterium]|jgi:hypothetical protein|nr:DUF1501 domain-containing protein [Planctomycetaceae bacterium]
MSSGAESPRGPLFLASRRELLRVGGLSLLGLSLPELLRGQARAIERPDRRPASFGKAKSCIVIFLKGGPSQLDTFDMKPDAPAEIRGEFKPIPTNVPEMMVCEQLPLLARQANKFTIARAVCHADNNHASAAYEMTTGNAYPRPTNLSGKSTREDHPHLGSAVAAVEANRCPVSPFAMVPQYLVVNGEFRSGQNAGFLGSRYDPLVPGGDPNNPDFKPVDLGLGASLEPEQLRNRHLLLESINDHDRRLGKNAALQALDANYQKAFALLESGLTSQALDIRREPASIREKYGRNFFGQSLLLARRLIEAGVRLVHVNCMSSIFGGLENWDTHKDNFALLKHPLLPRADRGVAAVLEDLSVRGLLSETLVVVTGEFGRTPRINAVAGRDHWSSAFSVLLAGAGVPGGRHYGATDKHGAYPIEKPVSSGQLAATIFHALGIDPTASVPTLLGRPWQLSTEAPVLELLG